MLGFLLVAFCISARSLSLSCRACCVVQTKWSRDTKESESECMSEEPSADTRALRSKSNQYRNTSLIHIEGVNTKEEVSWYCGKRMAYIYQAKVKKNGLHYHCIWAKFQDLMVTVGLFVLNSSPICLQSPGETELGSSCTPAISEILQPLDVRFRLPTT
ncbi:hypothetical protein AB3S75_007403 [Citrus x aurantiifolia]